MIKIRRCYARVRGCSVCRIRTSGQLQAATPLLSSGLVQWVRTKQPVRTHPEQKGLQAPVAYARHRTASGKGERTGLPIHGDLLSFVSGADSATADMAPQKKRFSTLAVTCG